MTLNTNKAVIAGVAAGIADDLHWPVSAIRLFYVISSFFFGLGIVLYVLTWTLNEYGSDGQMNLRMR